MEEYNSDKLMKEIKEFDYNNIENFSSEEDNFHVSKKLKSKTFFSTRKLIFALVIALIIFVILLIIFYKNKEKKQLSGTTDKKDEEIIAKISQNFFPEIIYKFINNKEQNNSLIIIGLPFITTFLITFLICANFKR